MKPVDQEFMHEPGRDQQGDCMRAVMASLLELPIASVPHFAQLDADGTGNFWLLLAEFCRDKGYSFVSLSDSRFFWADDAIYHIIEGPSPRIQGGHHVVVGRNGQVHFDPHPSRAGLAGDPSEWKFAFLVHRPTAQGSVALATRLAGKADDKGGETA